MELHEKMKQSRNVSGQIPLNLQAGSGAEERSLHPHPIESCYIKRGFARAYRKIMITALYVEHLNYYFLGLTQQRKPCFYGIILYLPGHQVGFFDECYRSIDSII